MLREKLKITELKDCFKLLGGEGGLAFATFDIYFALNWQQDLS
jgi:hypothetical protein